MEFLIEKLRNTSALLEFTYFAEILVNPQEKNSLMK